MLEMYIPDDGDLALQKLLSSTIVSTIASYHVLRLSAAMRFWLISWARFASALLPDSSWSEIVGLLFGIYTP